MNPLIRPALLAACTLLQAGAPAWSAAMPPGFGPQPALPEPHTTPIPTVNAAPAEPWQDEAGPVAAPGFAVRAYARGLAHPRWLYVLPNGDTLVAETGAAANRITLLRGIDANGQARTRGVFLQGLNAPFGMALVGDELYVANSDALLRFPYQPGQSAITAAGVKVMDLPAGPRNAHWTRNIVASPDGRHLYIAVGSASNVGEHGMEAEAGRAAVWQFERASGKARVYASGLRNPVGMAWQPDSGALWVAVNERDALGDDLVPDYMTALRDGGFYGWPYSYFGARPDPRVKLRRPELVARALVPDYALGAHTASLGLAFYDGQLFPPAYRGGAFIGQHGSWNRRPHSGYKVIFVPFANGQPAGPPQDILTGFLDRGVAHGRPVGVALDRAGALLVADDVGDTVWRVTPAAAR